MILRLILLLTTTTRNVKFLDFEYKQTQIVFVTVKHKLLYTFFSTFRGGTEQYQ